MREPVMARGRYVVAGILLVIPIIVFLAVPFYNVKNPEVGGVPFFYWWQTLWLGLSAVLFIIAALLIDWGDKEVEEGAGGLITDGR